MGQEKQTENLIKEHLTKRRLQGDKVFFYKQFQSGATKDGLPDVICSINGVFVGIEVKAYGKQPSTEQKVCGRNIINSNGVFVIVDDALNFVMWYDTFYKDISSHLGHFYNLTLQGITL